MKSPEAAIKQGLNDLAGEPWLWREMEVWSAARCANHGLWLSLANIERLRQRGSFSAGLKALSLLKTKGGERVWVDVIQAKIYLSWACCSSGLEVSKLALTAVRCARRAVERDPRCLAGYGMLAAGHSLRGENVMASRAASRALGARPESAMPYVLLARLCWKEKINEAIKYLTAAVVMDPTMGFAYGFRGELLRRNRMNRAALRDFARSLQLDPRSPRVHLWRARTLRVLGRYQKSFEDLDMALAEDSGRARSYAQRGLWFEGKMEWQRARQDYTRALRLEQDGAIDLAEIIETLESKQETIAWLLFRRFVVLGKMGAFKDAADDLNQAHSIDMKYAWDGCSRAEDGLSLGTLKRAMDQNPAWAWFYAWRGRAWINRGRFLRAEEDLEHAIRLGGESPWIYTWRGEARLRLNLDSSALADAGKALKSGIKYPGLFGLLAELEIRRNRFPMAARYARKAIGLYHSSVWAYVLLGEALVGMAEFDEARKALDQALKWDPNYGRAYLLRALTFLPEKDCHARAFEDLSRALRLGIDRKLIDKLKKSISSRTTG